MAISIDESRQIFWSALKKALGLTYEPPDLQIFFGTEKYKNLFAGIPEEQMDITDDKISLSVKKEYEENNAIINYSNDDIKNKSKEIREQSDELQNTVNNIFIWLHMAVYQN